MSRVLGDTTMLQTAVVKVVDSLIKEPAPYSLPEHI